MLLHRNIGINTFYNIVLIDIIQRTVYIIHSSLTKELCATE